jgi:PAS domain S-box-containing protein
MKGGTETARVSERAERGGHQAHLRISLLCFAAKQSDSRLITEKLAANKIDCSLVHAGSPEEFQAALGGCKFDLIISTFLPASYDGMAALAFARAVQPLAPFLYVSEPFGQEQTAESLKSGATEFIIKGHGESLAPAVRRVLLETARPSPAWPSQDMLCRSEAPVPDPARPADGNEPGAAEPGLTDWQLLLQSTALAAAYNGILITDREGLILWANPAFCKLTGYPVTEIVGRNPRIFKSNKHTPSFYREFWETIQSGRTWRGQFTNRRKDGSLYIVQQTVTPVLRGNGQINHFISISEDVTDRSHLEEQLLRAQKMEAVGQLAAGVAHEFNNLLTVIRCNSELLAIDKGRLTAAESAELLRHIMTASDRGARLTRELLEFCQEHVLQCSEVDLNMVVETRVLALSRASGNDVQWHCSYAPGLPPVRADARMIQQLVANLASNAINAMPLGGRIFIRTEKAAISAATPPAHPQAQPGEFVCVTVRDTGCGIAPENLPRIFEPFFTTNEPGKGTGLGLAVVYGIVKQHQGWIEVTSKPGCGTTFKVFLPARTATVTAAANKSFPA